MAYELSCALNSFMMVLLTSSTVSFILTSSVVSVFTFLLFISGYALQQQSVRNIQTALRVPTASPSPIARNGESGFLSVTGSSQQILSNSDIDNKGNYAYLQLLSTPDPSNICSAILFFKALSTNGTAIQDRLFMYPQEWDTIPPEKLTQPVATALSLLRAASIKYEIWLLPIDMSVATSAGYAPTDTRLLRLGQIQFMQYDSVLYVRTPGMLLDTAKLDAMLLSRPLPLKHDKRRVESYNNEAWIPMPLRADRDAQLPPVYLIAVNNVPGHVEARAHIPDVRIPGFGDLVTGPWGVTSRSEGLNAEERPGYVYFEYDEDGHVKWKDNPLYGAWRAQQYEECDGLDFDAYGYDDT